MAGVSEVMNSKNPRVSANPAAAQEHRPSGENHTDRQAGDQEEQYQGDPNVRRPSDRARPPGTLATEPLGPPVGQLIAQRDLTVAACMAANRPIARPTEVSGNHGSPLGKPHLISVHDVSNIRVQWPSPGHPLG